jgi:CheY-like chemotaxis protein
MQDFSSMRSRLEPHLPHLRLYARALAGSQHAGDALVRTLLSALVDQPGALSARAEPRLQLFQLFHSCHDPDHPGFCGHAGTSLPHPGRQALLLSVVEGFTLAQTAKILSETEAEVAQAIATARTEIAEMIRSRILIVEDEPLIAMHLEHLMEDMGHSVVAIAASRDEAVIAAQTHAPDLLLVDIQLLDGSSGIDAANSIVAQFDIPVIFITAFPERLLTGEPPEPAFLVTKPFDPDAVIATVGQALLARLPEFASAT